MVEKELEPICEFITKYGNAGANATLVSLCSQAKNCEEMLVDKVGTLDCRVVETMGDDLQQALMVIAKKCEFREAT